MWTPPTDYAPWLWGFFVLHLAIGLAFSPVTGLRLVRVVGANVADRERISRFLESFEATPYTRLNEAQLATLALENRAIEGARFRSNLFGRGVLELAYKRPVALVEGSESLYLSSTGSLFTSKPNLGVNLVVSAPGAVPGANLSVFSSWRSGVAARMCENVGERLPEMDWRMVVTASGFVSLEPISGGTVEFGSFEDADEKVQALVGILKDDPEKLSKVRKLVLTSPSNPVIVP